ncbi:MAG: hypothetical protein Tp165SUR256671_5 [Prokaryotic dsDNA virus sp.]|nr:MAG: hypothetical protein Tp165SUR256671_5 [Prokaryotic dsDNA virus sp.]|tara:strand:- start:1614 stop:1895 length:282 start_codon:yes stop_codon:yes gene_type:complete
MTSYDNWKLSNPIDDGNGYNMVSTCCGVELEESEYSECCGAKYVGETDLCSDCLEHCGEYMVCGECGYECDEIEDYEYEAIQRENYLEDMRNE